MWFKIANITHALPVPVYWQTDLTPKRVWSFRVYMIPLRDFVPEWNSRPGTTTGVNSRRGDSRRHDILWWYHVNKCRAMRGNRSELAPARKSPWCHVNTPLLDPEMTLFRFEGLLVSERSCSLVPWTDLKFLRCSPKLFDMHSEIEFCEVYLFSFVSGPTNSIMRL